MKKILFVIIISLVASTLMAQEKQVPFFPESGTYIITKKIAKEYGLFTDYKKFEEARLFELPDSSFALEVIYFKEGQRFKNRRVMSKEEKEAFILSLKEKIKENYFSINLDQSGRPALLLGSSIVGLSYYSTAMNTILDTYSSDNYKLPMATYMLTAGLSFVIPYTTTKDIPVSRSQASLVFHGQTRGILHGMAIAYIIDNDYYNDNEFSYKGNINDLRVRLAFGTAVSGAEGIIGFRLAKKWNFNRGDASIFQLGGDAGAGFGLLVSDIFGLYDRPTAQAAIGLGMLSSFAGYYYGKELADKHEYTLGDAIALRSTMLIGGLVSNTLVNYVASDSHLSEPYAIGTIVGCAAGAYFGKTQLDGKDLTNGQGILIGLGSSAGSLIGLGLGFLAMPDEEENSNYLLTGASIGALGGYFITFGSIANKLAFDTNEKFDINLTFNPAALFLNNNYNSLRPDYIPTFASLSIRF